MHNRQFLTLGSTALLLPAVLAGCRSPYIAATVENQTGGQVSLVEVDYPSASFGKESIPNGDAFHYRFKVLGSGQTSVVWTDAGHHQHTSKGPDLHELQEGSLTVVLGPSSATWQTQLHDR